MATHDMPDSLLGSVAQPQAEATASRSLLIGVLDALETGDVVKPPSTRSGSLQHGFMMLDPVQDTHATNAATVQAIAVLWEALH
ncbi:hypothetical protein QRX50_39865 [Amycolatopsis carbonis]|uniref:Uncharacterized protein n=1 Tax=Amycolatopsis carbonis TaxID=715471 RepID=A0A9Y2ICP5_9PSEU|nr:hypothetical protein [Amycolatopsis sp. 2-15]WIX77504.1 hypothetical protein QRX50_39865 [Amycolatopsis sp. 2-15]